MKTVNITTLPQHTRETCIFTEIVRCINGESEGFTKSTRLTTPKNGYLVGTGWKEKAFNKQNVESIKPHVADMFNLMQTGEGLFISGWNHEGNTIVEISEGFTNLLDAVRVGESRKQISIWDVENQKEIVL